MKQVHLTRASKVVIISVIIFSIFLMLLDVYKCFHFESITHIANKVSMANEYEEDIVEIYHDSYQNSYWVLSKKDNRMIFFITDISADVNFRLLSDNELLVQYEYIDRDIYDYDDSEVVIHIDKESYNVSITRRILEFLDIYVSR